MATTRLESDSHPSRRQFVEFVGGAALAAAGAATTVRAQTVEPHIIDERRLDWLIHAGDTVLFQGDSITDAGRKKDDAAANSQAALGNGYAWLATAQSLVDRPDDGLNFYNRGISGNKVYQLAERWAEECLALEPNVLSHLNGVNDFWHKHKHGYEGTLETYQSDYRALIEGTKQALPEVRLVICEPFVLKVGAVDDSWFPEFDGYRAAAKTVAEEAGAIFVPFQSLFDAATKLAPPERWAADGVHPTADGAAIMAHWWLNAVGA
jgi:lysophospholipase L1-like esterase